jgi:FkbM family methyltransferase
MNFWGTYIGDNKVFVRLQAGGKLYAYADDLSITPALMLDGLLEIGLTNYMIANLQPGMTVVDVGANIGYFSIIAGYKVGESGRVMAYEANPKNYDIMVDNLTINELKHNVDPFALAVSDSDQQLQFHVSERFQGNSSLKSHSDQYRQDFKSDCFDQIPVYAVSLDTQGFGKIDLLKVDVEGAELQVFRGASRLIANGKITTAVFELNKSMLQEDTQPFEELLKDYERNGAIFHLLEPNGMPYRTTVDEIFKKDYIDNILIKF